MISGEECDKKKYKNGFINTVIVATATTMILKLDIHQPGQ
jgi:hypothetical protein